MLNTYFENCFFYLILLCVEVFCQFRKIKHILFQDYKKIIKMKKKLKKNSTGTSAGHPERTETRFSKLSLLKKSSTKFPDSPEKANIEVFDNIYASRNYEIVFECFEFTALCPVTGQPDFGKIEIKYVPDKLCIESKSLKLFLFSFRNCNIFHEEAVNLILDAIVKACSPISAEVLGRFMPRGGIAINVRAEFKRK